MRPVLLDASHDLREKYVAYGRRRRRRRTIKDVFSTCQGRDSSVELVLEEHARMLNILYCIFFKFNYLHIRGGTNNKYCDLISCGTEAYCR